MLEASPCECVQQSGFSGVTAANRLPEQEIPLSTEQLQLSMDCAFVRVLVEGTCPLLSCPRDKSFTFLSLV